MTRIYQIIAGDNPCRLRADIIHKGKYPFLIFNLP